MMNLLKRLVFVVFLFSPCLLHAQIVINEILADPDATNGDANGDGAVETTVDEFVELVNTSNSDIDISGWTLSDGFGVRHTFPVGTVVSTNCAIIVFAGGSPTGTFGNAIVQTASSGGLGLNNTGDTITLNDGTSDVATESYGGEGGDNQSLTRDPDITGSFVKHSGATGSGGALFSPGTKINGDSFSGCASTPTTGSIKVIKVTDPSGGAGFDFTGTLGNFSLDDGQEQEFTALAAGDYDITETVPSDWEIDNIDVSGGSSTAITNGVTVHLQAGDDVTVTFTNTEVTATPSADLRVEKSDDPDPVFVGDNITYTIRVINDGPTAAADVALADTLPSDVTFVSASQGSESGGIVTASLGTIADDDTVEVEIVVQADATGTQTNRVGVESSTDDPDLTNNTASEETTVNDLPSTSVIINELDSDTPGSDTAEFIELFDGGSGNTSLTGMVLVLFNGSTDESNGAFDLDGHSTDSDGYFVIGNSGAANVDLVISNGTLQNGPEAVALYFGDASDFPNGTPVTTSGLIDAIVYDTDDPDDAGLLALLNSGQPQANESGGGDSANHSLQRIPNGSGGARNTSSYQAIPPTPGAENLAPANTDVTIEKSANAGTIFIGDEITYTIIVENTGSDLAENVVVTDTLPSGLAYVSGSTTVGSVSESSGVVTANIGDLPGSSDAEITIVVTANNLGTFVNEASVTTDTDETDDSNNSDSATTEVITQPTTSVLINEIDSDTPGIDSLEFVELFDGGSGNTSLDGLVLVFFNGGTDASYAAFDLDGRSTDGAGFFVLGNSDVDNVDLVFSDNSFQNGPDAVALFFGDASDFPNGAAVTTSGLVDAIVYDTNDADDAGLLVLLNSGQPQVNENDGGDSANHSLQRIPNGSGGTRNTSSYTTIPPTPGAVNAAPAPVTDLTISKTGNADTVYVGANITYTISVNNGGSELAENVTVSDTIPSGLTYVSSSTTSGSVSESSGIVTATLGDLAGAGTAEVTIVATTSSTGLVVNRAHVATDTDESDEDNNTASDTTTVLVVPTTSVIINEIDSDSPGTDDQEFVELYDGGSGNTSLSGMVLVLFNGSDDLSYAAYDLDGETTDGDGYFVIGSANTSNVNKIISNAALQNGPDAVALYVGNSSDFPNDTPISTTLLIDAVVYGTNDPEDTGLLDLLNSGQSQVDESAGGDSESHSLQRIPNGSGGARNTSTYQAATPTPGAENQVLATPDIAVDVSNLDFGERAVGSSRDREIEIENEGDADLEVDDIDITGSDADEWKVKDGDAPFTLSPAEKKTVTIRFSPKSAGDKEATVEISSNDPDESVVEVRLEGTGLAPDIDGPDRNHRFGFVDVGTTEETSFEIENVGNADLDVHRLTVGGSSAEQYMLVEPMDPFVLEPGESKRFHVIFAPDTIGVLRGRVRFYSNDPDEPQFAVGFVGEGQANPNQNPDISVSPASIDFGAVQVGANVERTVTVRNDSLGMLEVTAADFSGADAGDWQIISGGAPFTLLANQSRTLRLRFAPATAGTKTATLTLTSNDPDESEVTVLLTGEALAPAGKSSFDSLVVINEIHYNPASAQGPDLQFEFLELHNPSDSTDVDLAGFTFSAGVTHTFVAGDTLHAGQFLVLTADSTSYPNSIEWTSGNLVNGGELITLLDNSGALVDSVNYGVSAPWPSQPNGSGPSLELRSPILDNSLPESWQASLVDGGTPGAANSSPDVEEPDIHVSPQALAFGDVELGAASNLNVTVTNLGAQDLTVSTTNISGTDASLFSVNSGAAPFTLTTGQSQTVTIQFSPTTEGGKTAQIDFTSNDPDEGIVSVSLTGTGVTVTGSPFAGVIIINELHYNPSTGQGNDSDFEFLELANTSADDIDLADFSFAAGVNHTFRSGDLLPANGFLVLAINPDMYDGSLGWTSGNLVNTGELVELVDPDGATVDAVEYGVSGAWPSAPNGGGPSLELIDTALDNSKPESWQASATIGGTPGAANSAGGFVASEIAVDPRAYDFGVLNEDDRSQVTMTIINEGGARLDVSEIALSGAASEQFQLQGTNTPFSLAPGDGRNFEVRAKPAASGTQHANLQITSNAPGSNELLVTLEMYVNSAPSTPILVGPAWGADANLLVWRKAHDPDSDDQHTYKIELATDEKFENIIHFATVAGDTSLSLNDLAESGQLILGAYYYWHLRAEDDHGALSPNSVAGYFRLSNTPTSVAAGALPEAFDLAQNYPNPFNPETKIRYALPVFGTVTLTIYNLRGREVRKLLDAAKIAAGAHIATWDGRSREGVPAPTGAYFYRIVIEAPGQPRFVMVKKMILLK